MIEPGYAVAVERDLANIGKQLKQIYEHVMEL